MKIFFFLSIGIIGILFLGKNIFHSAKRNLFKDQAAWAGNDIKIKYRNTSKVRDTDGRDNYLERIANESKIYLEEESNKSNE